MKNVVIAEAKRTPQGSFGGSLAGYSAAELGATAIFEVIKSSGIKPDDVQEVVFGNVLTAGVGQAPARQAAIKAGITEKAPCTTVNKVCASGMKAIMIATDQIQLGQADIMIAGGMESMSNVPHYLPGHRFGTRLGTTETVDGILKDGLHDAFRDFHMGAAAEICAEKYSITRAEQDEYAIRSYKKAMEAHRNGWLEREIIRMKFRNRKGDTTLVTEDEELKRVDFDKIPLLKPYFKKKGTITAANASSINDGAAALLLMSEEKADELGISPFAVIRSHGSTATAPEWFTTAPADAIPVALFRAGLEIGDMDLFEINEAFSVVNIANNRLLDIDPDKVNIHGGAVSIGHPIGSSGARIVVTLLHALMRTGGRFGCAGICNGGGGASAMVIEML